MGLRHRTSSTALAAGACALLLGCSGTPPSDPETSTAAAALDSAPAEESYAGSASCRECHEAFYELWAPSHHGLAMQPYTDEFAGQNLQPQTEDLVLGDRRYRAEIASGQGWVLEIGKAGSKRLPIEYVLGGKNVYYFLTPMEKGRLQTLPVAYDVHGSKWFDTAGSGVRHFPGEEAHEDAPVQWTDWQYTFNTACHSCHVSQLDTNYDAAANLYRTTWREPGIACETCHGPAREHVRVARETPAGQALSALHVIRVKTMSPARRSDLCATCHAKMTPLTSSFTPGDRFFDHFDLTTFEDPDFYPDGRDLGENYTYTSWLMSPCAQSGELDCIHCHTSSGRYRFATGDYNDACMPCHANQVRDVVAHSHHAADSEASRCISCHMPMTKFARMNRSDHSMRPPAPAATNAFQSPNACNGCHADQSPSWADRYVRQWHSKDYEKPVLRVGRMIAAARKQDWSALPAILEYIASPGRQEVFATSLIRLVAPCPDRRVLPALIQAIEDTSPLVRSAAVGALSLHPSSPEAVSALVKAAGDDYRLVRIRAAAGLLEYPRDRLEGNNAARVASATEEYLHFITARPDQWASHYNVGNYYLARGDLRQAAEAFDKAIEKEPRAILPLVNASITRARMGEMDQAEQLLRQALQVSPDNAEANFNLGLLEAEQGNRTDAERHLRAALRADPQMAQAAYNLGLLVAGDRPGDGVRLCARAFELSPSPRYGYSLAYLFRQKGDVEPAVRTLRDLIERWPENVDSYVLLADIYARNRRYGDFDRLLERARSERAHLPGAVLVRLEAMREHP